MHLPREVAFRPGRLLGRDPPAVLAAACHPFRFRRAALYRQADRPVPRHAGHFGQLRLHYPHTEPRPVSGHGDGGRAHQREVRIHRVWGQPAHGETEGGSTFGSFLVFCGIIFWPRYFVTGHTKVGQMAVCLLDATAPSLNGSEKAIFSYTYLD